MVVGGSALRAILAQKLAPGLLDRYLARAGYDGQLADAPVEPGRPDNLYAPAPGDLGAAGPFSAVAGGRSLQLWLRMRPGQIASALGALALAPPLAALVLRRR
jgi:hypothetical protein